MTNREMEQRLKKAFENAAPRTLPFDAEDVFAEEETEPISIRPPVRMWKSLVAVAAVFVLIAVTAILWRMQTPIASMKISLDVNPSVVLEIDKNEKVVAVNTLNADGTIVVGARDWNGDAVETVVQSLVRSMVQNGYLNINANSILISVDGADMARATEMEQKLATEVKTILSGGEFEGAVLSQTLSEDEGLVQQAAQYGISVGKAMLVRRIVELNPQKSFDDLALLSINELNLLCSPDQMPQVNGSGNASERAYIAKEAAVFIALNHLGITREQAVNLEIEFDCEHGVMCYEIEFVYAHNEYEYEIQAATGEIVSVESDRDEGDEELDDDDDDHRTDDAKGTLPSASNTTKPSASTSAATTTVPHVTESSIADVVTTLSSTIRPSVPTSAVTTTVPSVTETTASVTTTTSTQSATARITKEQLKAIVLAHAGVAESAIRRYEVELNRRNGIEVYEVEFRCGGTEYEYRVHALTGEILHVETEIEND